MLCLWYYYRRPGSTLFPSALPPLSCHLRLPRFAVKTGRVVPVIQLFEDYLDVPVFLQPSGHEERALGSAPERKNVMLARLNRIIRPTEFGLLI